MKLITHYGIRTDRRLTRLEALQLRIRQTPYQRLQEAEKLHLRDLLAAEHTRREAIRFAPINRR